MKKNTTKQIWMWIVALSILAIFTVKLPSYYPETHITMQHKKDYFGVTFSKKFTEELNMDWKEVYQAILDDLKVKHIRVPIYWDDIEQKEGDYNFGDYDYIFDEGKKRNAKFVVNLGWRLPRWPECHTPNWLIDAETKTIREKSLKMIEEVVTEYKTRSEIIYWQVENEPLLKYFGECPKPDYDFLKKQIDLVKNLDDRKIIISASGELSTWRKEAKVADILGITFYRVVWSKYFGFIRYPVPLLYYQAKAAILNIAPENRIITELQLEPWTPKGKIIDLEKKEIDKSMSIRQFKSNLQYAVDLNWQRAYAWGVEWWYWQKEYGDEAYWGTAKKLFE